MMSPNSRFRHGDRPNRNATPNTPLAEVGLDELTTVVKSASPRRPKSVCINSILIETVEQSGAIAPATDIAQT